MLTASQTVWAGNVHSAALLEADLEAMGRKASALRLYYRRLCMLTVKSWLTWSERPLGKEIE